MNERNTVLESLPGGASISDLKAVSEILMDRHKVNDYHLALIRDKSYAVVNGKTFSFYNNHGVANLLEGVNKGVFPRKKVLLDVVSVLESFEGDTYFDHKSFAGKVRKHVTRR